MLSCYLFSSSSVRILMTRLSMLLLCWAWPFKLIFCSIQLVTEVTSQWLRSQLSGPEFLLSSWHSGKSCSTFSVLHYMFSPVVHAPLSILRVQMKLCGRHIQIHACVYYTDIALLWGKQWCFIPSCLKWGSHC